MRRRDIALHLLLTLGAMVIVLAVMVAALPRIRPDTIHLTLHYNGKPLPSVPALLIVNHQGNPICQSEGRLGQSGLRGPVWERQLRERPWQGFRPLVDEVAVCALVGGEYRLLWKRNHVGWKEMLNLSCNIESNSAIACVAEEDVTLGQTTYLAVLALLISLLARVFWNRSSELAASVTLVFLLAGIFGACLVYAIPMSVDLQRFVSVALGGLLVGIHISLGRVFRQFEEVSGAPETGNSGGLGS